jgi:hypothetical protein
VATLGTRSTSKSLKLTAACLLAGSIVGWQAPALAGSDYSSDAYAGDYSGGSLPTGTFLALQYLGFSHSDTFISPGAAATGFPTGTQVPNGHADVLEEYQRFVYFADIGGHPLALQAVVPFANLSNVNIPSADPSISTRQVGEGFGDPVLFFTYWFISDAKTQRWLGFTDYSYLPLGSYDNTKVANVATARQYTNVPEFGYTEGLGKFAPALKGFFFDLVGNASFHTDGSDPINFITPFGPNTLIYDTLTQSTSYDVKAFLRYDPMPLGFVALGIEKSWGGQQTATNGTLLAPAIFGGGPQAPLVLGDDDYLRGHFQFSIPLARDFTVAADVFTDFQREAGFKDDYGAEIRLTKFFFPAPAPAASGPMYTK